MSFRTISGVEIPDEWAQYSTQQAAEFEIVHRPLWDTQTFVDATTLSLNFFATGQANQGLGNEVFPLKNSFLCAAIGVYFKDGAQDDNLAASGSAFASRFNDHVLITNTGVLNITIGQKLYGPFPLWKLIPGAGVWGIISSAGSPTSATASVNAANYSQLGMPDPRAMYKLAIPLVIPATTNVALQMNWAATVDITGNSTICLCLEGKEARPIQ